MLLKQHEQMFPFGCVNALSKAWNLKRLFAITIIIKRQVPLHVSTLLSMFCFLLEIPHSWDKVGSISFVCVLFFLFRFVCFSSQAEHLVSLFTSILQWVKHSTSFFCECEVQRISGLFGSSGVYYLSRKRCTDTALEEVVFSNGAWRHCRTK